MNDQIHYAPKKKSQIAQKPSNLKYDAVNLINKMSQYRSFEGSAGDIREVSIYPDLKDLSNSEFVFLNPLSVDKVFDSCDQYLETHFRLIREDFVQSLREGFQLYQEELKVNKLIKNFSVSIFRKVRAIK